MGAFFDQSAHLQLVFSISSCRFLLVKLEIKHFMSNLKVSIAHLPRGEEWGGEGSQLCPAVSITVQRGRCFDGAPVKHKPGCVSCRSRTCLASSSNHVTLQLSYQPDYVKEYRCQLVFRVIVLGGGITEFVWERDVWKPSALPKQPACHTRIMFSSCDAGRKWCCNELHSPALQRGHGTTFPLPLRHTCTFSPSWPHLYLLSLMSVIWAGIVLKLLRPNRFSRSLPFHSYQSSSHRFPLSFSLFFHC